MSNSIVNVQKELCCNAPDFAEQWAEIGKAIAMLSENKIRLQIVSEPEFLLDQENTVIPLPIFGTIMSSIRLTQRDIAHINCVAGQMRFVEGQCIIDTTPEGEQCLRQLADTETLTFAFVARRQR